MRNRRVKAIARQIVPEVPEKREAVNAGKGSFSLHGQVAYGRARPGFCRAFTSVSANLGCCFPNV